MAVYIGSARVDERGTYSGGTAGDQKQKSAPDYSGEVSMEKFYVHSKGWYVFRAKDVNVAMGIAAAMITACNNANIGYSQSDRYGVVKNGTGSKVKTNADCSSLVRTCVKEASGKDPGDFNTSTEPTALMNTGLFTKYTYSSGMTLYTGDVLVTKTKGHTVVVTTGAARSVANNTSYYPIYSGNSTSIVAALAAVGVADTSFTNRTKIANANGIANYSGTAVQNTTLLNLLKQGKLKKISGTTATTSTTSSYYSKYTGKSTSLVAALTAVGVTDTSYNHRAKIAAANGISGYSGTAAQNTKMLTLLKEGKLKKA